MRTHQNSQTRANPAPFAGLAYPTILAIERRYSRRSLRVTLGISTMRSLLCFAFTVLIAVPSTQAAIVSYNFTASILTMYEWNPAARTITVVDRSSFPGFIVDSSWGISGIYRYDTLAPLNPDYQPYVPAGGQDVVYRSSTLDPGIAYTFTGGHVPFQSSGALWLEVANDASSAMGWDVFHTYGRMALENSMFQEVTLNLSDQTATAFDSAAIPLSLNINAFHFNRLNTLFARDDGSSLTVEAVLFSWTVADPSVVPEPNALLLVATGMFLALGSIASRAGNRTT